MLGLGQEVKNVLEAFESLSIEPEVLLVSNNLEVPMQTGHLQGVQVIEQKGKYKLLISGSSLTESYLLQVDLVTLKTERLIPLMKSPFRHAGGFQVSSPYLAVGIEDNFIKTTSKICLYNYRQEDLYNAQANLVIDRKGEAKLYTAGTTGILDLESSYLSLVSNWDSRNWDFYSIVPEKSEQKFLHRFNAPDNWGSYQSINLIMDEEAIYAIGTYQKELVGIADLILVSKRGPFEPIMKLIKTKTFNCKKGVDFSTAAGIQVDKEGDLHIWGTQRDASEKIAINRFSQE